MAKSAKKPMSEQSRRFIKAAREAGASEDERVFDKNLKRIVKAKPTKSDEDWVGTVEVYSDEIDPPGKKDEFAVGWFVGEGGTWHFKRVENREEAETVFGKARHLPNLYRVLLPSGVRSPIIWMQMYDGKTWLIIKLTDGYRHEYEE